MITNDVWGHMISLVRGEKPCPECEAALDQVREELERLTELAEEWRDNYADAQGDAACNKAQAEAFATLAKEQKARAEKAEAELAAARPLLEAATEWDGTIKNSHDLQAAALAYRQAKGAKP